MVNTENYKRLLTSFNGKATLVAVSKFKTAEDILELYHAGQRDFGENYVQELIEKQQQLPKDIRWHFIGHLQSNKIKYIAPFIHLVESVDSFKLLLELNKQAKKNDRVIDCLLQVHIAEEDTKFGLNDAELDELISEAIKAAESQQLQNIRIAGLMGMASLTENEQQVRKEFGRLKRLYNRYASFEAPVIRFNSLSMGMSNDYELALEEGANMLRIGSLLFGKRS